MREAYKSATSNTQYLGLRSSTTGLGVTGKVFTDVTGSYTRNRAARTAITMATLASASTAWSSGGFIEVDATNCPGLYRFDVPDAAFATGVDKVIVSVKVTGAIEEHLEIVLTDWNKQVASIPNAVAGANTGLPTVDANNAVKVQSGTGANQISLAAGLVDVTQTAADKVWASASRTLTAFSLTLAQQVWDVLAASVAAANSIGLQLKTNVDAAITSRLAPTTALRTLDVSATGEAGLDFDNIKDATGAHTLTNIRVPNVTLTDTVTTYTGNTPQTGDNFARLGAPVGASISADVAGVPTTVWAAGTRTLSSFGTLVADVTTAVWTALTSGLTTAGSIGKLLVDNINATISSRLATVGYTAPPAAASISTAVWTEPLPGAFGAGSAGAKLNTASAAGDPWATALPGAYGAGTAGFIVGSRLDVVLSTRLATSGYTSPPSATSIASQIINTALAELGQAQVNATPTVGEALMVPFMLIRNGGDTNATTSTMKNDAGVVIMKRTISDDTVTFSEGKLASGP